MNILILRRVRPERRDEFEAAVRDWIPRAVRFPGHMGVFMLKPAPGGHEYGALLRFADQQAWQEFSEWEDYRAFLSTIRILLTDEPTTEVLHGMEAWFRPPTEKFTRQPPRWKMALLTYLGVCIMVWIASYGIRGVAPELPRWPAYFLVNAIVVTGLTWGLMPLLVRLCRKWIYAGRGA